MKQENYTFKWQGYSDHLRNMMKEMMLDNDFTDVTLVSEDRKHIRAHKNILSASSPVLKDILRLELEDSAKTTIFLNEIESIMQFI